MTITPHFLFRSAAVAAVAAGLLFIGIQLGHPHSDVTAVTTTEWAVRNSAKVVMGALALVGITGMYLRQVKQVGRLGLLGATSSSQLAICASSASRSSPPSSCRPSPRPTPATSTTSSPRPPTVLLSATSA